MDTTTIRPAEGLGPVLTSRSVGEVLRHQIEAAAQSGEVVVDFAGVEAMSPSFADEIFAKLSSAAGQRTRFVNLSDDLIVLMRFVVAGREAAADTA